jgi:hypothetical protein
MANGSEFGLVDSGTQIVWLVPNMVMAVSSTVRELLGAAVETMRVSLIAFGRGQDRVVVRSNREVSYPPNTKLPDVFSTVIFQSKHHEM